VPLYEAVQVTAVSPLHNQLQLAVVRVAFVVPVAAAVRTRCDVAVVRHASSTGHLAGSLPARLAPGEIHRASRPPIAHASTSWQ
jgi:hypothetical protein